MSDELKSQPSQASVPEQQQQQHVGRNQAPGASLEDPLQQQQQQQQQQPYHYHGGGNNYSQRGSRGGHHNNRQGQQRGGRYGSNKYNTYPNNAGQYNRYNNGVGNGNRNYTGGYKSHRGSMNNAAAMNMQWPGYYNSPPIYYVPPQLVPAANAAAAAATGAAPAAPGGGSTDASSSSSPVSSASGTSTPQPKKIEITTKTGQHLDLNALHSQHSGHPGNAAASPVNNNSANSSNNQDEEPNAASNSPQVPEKKEDASDKEASLNGADGGKEDAEKTRREFLEQIKLRKQALEKKKQEEALKKQEEENKAKQASNPVQEPVQPLSEPLQETKSVKELAKEPGEEPVKESLREAAPASVSAEERPPALEERPVPTEGKPSTAEEKPVTTEEKSPSAGEASSLPDSASPETVQPEKPKSGTYAEKLAARKQQKAQEAAKAESEKKEDQEPSNDAQGEKAQEVSKEQPSAQGESTISDLASTSTAEAVPKDTAESTSETAPKDPEPAPEVKTEVTEESSAVKPEVQEGIPSTPSEEAPATTADTPAADDESIGTMTQLLERLKNADPIEDVYSFSYPEGIESPDPKYKSTHRKYTYGPTFLLQFKDKVKVKPDDEWVKDSISKIVITPAMMKLGKPRDAGPFGGGPGGRGGDFRKSGSLRNMEGRSNSRSSSKKKSKRMMDDRKSNRPYTSRRDRERNSERDDQRDDDKPKEEVKPLVPSANRWVPKSKQKKSEKKLAPDGVTELLDKEEAERNMKSLLNKLTLEMFDQISSQILSIADQSKWETQGETLKVVIEEIFHKACDEPHWSSMYAQLCGKVVKELNPDISDDTNEGKKGPKLVLHYLVARCHAEFEKGWSDKLPTKEDGSPIEPEMMSDEYYKMAAAKRRGLGLVRFIGFLYRLNLLTGKMMFECFRRLMKDLNNAPTEETLESVVELLNTVGEQFETDSFSAGQATLEGSALLDSLFVTLQEIVAQNKVSSRMKFKLVDLRELREERHWNSDKKQDGPKTIQQIHEEEKERQMRNSNSRSNSRRVNNSMGGRNSSRREMPSVSKDHFISTRSASLRHAQKSVPKEEPRKSEKSATNMFSALMDSNEDEE
ncbi:related to Eukaryotic initiation factor 4F subunit p150 [Zygosaccharomyces bailii]|nr:related to Eukaryotic initiation factor 4F subunit p150 [Zygosaccharomyces bailii]